MLMSTYMMEVLAEFLCASKGRRPRDELGNTTVPTNKTM